MTNAKTVKISKKHMLGFRSCQRTSNEVEASSFVSLNAAMQYLLRLKEGWGGVKIGFRSYFPLSRHGTC